MQVVNLRGREHEPAVIALIAAAQIHHAREDALLRAPGIASEYAASAELRLWGIEEQGVVLAIAGIEVSSAGCAILRDLAVASAQRHHGMGRSLLDYLREGGGFTRIEGDTLESSAGFYRGCGFSVREDGAMPDGETRYRFSWQAAARP